jgi:hypothetical protein
LEEAPRVRTPRARGDAWTMASVGDPAQRVARAKVCGEHGVVATRFESVRQVRRRATSERVRAGHLLQTRGRETLAGLGMFGVAKKA